MCLIGNFLLFPDVFSFLLLDLGKHPFVIIICLALSLPARAGRPLHLASHGPLVFVAA